MITINSKELTMENRGVSYMEQTSHFARVLAFLEEKGWKYSHCCEDDCGSIDFEYREFPIISGNFMMEMSGVWRPTSATAAVQRS